MGPEEEPSAARRRDAEDVDSGRAPDVVLILNQLELPDDFVEADLDQIRAEISDSQAKTEVAVPPEAAPRDPFTAAAAIFIIHFVTAHGLEVSLGVLEAGIWEGIKSVFGKLHRRRIPDGDGGHDPARRFRVGITYPDGTTTFVEAASAEELREAVRTRRPAGA